MSQLIARNQGTSALLKLVYWKLHTMQQCTNPSQQARTIWLPAYQVFNTPEAFLWPSFASWLVHAHFEPVIPVHSNHQICIMMDPGFAS